MPVSFPSPGRSWPERRRGWRGAVNKARRRTFRPAVYDSGYAGSRGWGWTASRIRQARLIEWAVRAASRSLPSWSRRCAGGFKLSTDPLFIEKVVDVVGLYHDPPQKAVVLCVLGQHVAEMLLAEDQDVVEALAAKRAHEPFRVSVGHHRQLHPIRMIGIDVCG